MKSFYCVALVLLLECSSVYTLPTVTPQTATVPGACDITSITTCFTNIGISYETIFSSLISSSENFEGLCRNYTIAKLCMAPYVAGGRCSGMEAVGINTIINGFDYLCSPRGRQTVELFGTCFGNRVAITGLQQCSTDIVKHLDVNNLCTLPQFYLSCSVNVSQMYCNRDVSRAMQEMILTLFQAYTDAYNCNYSIADLGTEPTRMSTTTRRPISPWITYDMVTSNPQPVTSRPSACSFSTIGRCLSSLSEHNALLPWQRGQSGNIDDIDLDLACIAYDSIKDCYKEAVKFCSPIESIQFELLISMYEYVCTPSGKQQFKSMYQCFSNKEALSKIRQCSNMSGLDLSNPCSLADHFISCSANVSRDYCNSTPALTAIVTASFKPYQTVFNCNIKPQPPQPRLCSPVALGKCLRNVTDFAILPWQTGGSVSDLDIDAICSSMESATDCYNKELSYCEAKFSFDSEVVMSMYTYVCSTEGKKNYQSLRQCYNNQQALSAMSNCRNISGVDLSKQCNIPQHFINCADEASRKYCNSSPAVTEIVKASFKPYETVFNCDLSVSGDGNNSNPSHTGNFLIISALMLVIKLFC